MRDLGGHPTEDGRVTRFRAVVRADSIWQLTDRGWEALVSYGIRTIVDLRLEVEREVDPPHPSSVEIVHVPLGGERLELAWGRGESAAEAVQHAYAELLTSSRRGVASAVTAVGRAPEGGVLVHCFVGKDRAGLVAALLLRLARVGLGDIASDYGQSGENIRPLVGPWIAQAPDDTERERRRRIASSPPQAMVAVLAELERSHGSVNEYLMGGGATEDDLERTRSRLLG